VGLFYNAPKPTRGCWSIHIVNEYNLAEVWKLDKCSVLHLSIVCCEVQHSKEGWLSADCGRKSRKWLNHTQKKSLTANIITALANSHNKPCNNTDPNNMNTCTNKLRYKLSAKEQNVQYIVNNLLFHECYSRCRFLCHHPLCGVDSVHLQILLTALVSLSVTNKLLEIGSQNWEKFGTH